jgi:hypothetical protein
MRKTLLGFLMAMGLAILMAGCNKDEAKPADGAIGGDAPPTVNKTAGGSGGAVASPSSRPAPSGAQTGNFQGGKK